MKNLLTLLPLTFALCGCSAFVPVVLEKNTIKESQSLKTKLQANNSQGDYYATANDYPCDVYFGLEIYNFSGTGKNQVVYDIGDGNLVYRDINLGDRLVINLPKGLIVTIENENTTAVHTEGRVVVTYNEYSYMVETQKDRIFAQYDYLQAHTLTDLKTTQGMFTDELTSEAYPEMYFGYEVNYDGESPTWNKPLLEINFTKFFNVSYSAFGCGENEGSSYYKLGDPVALRFNAKTDYGFYYNNIANYRQVAEANGFLDTSVETLDQLEAPYNDFGSLLAVDISSGFLNQDVSYKVASIPLDLGMRGAYADGYNDGKIEGNKPVSWFKNIFDGMASFFSVEIIPNISLGLIVFSPLLVLAIIVIVRIFKHGD